MKEQKPVNDDGTAISEDEFKLIQQLRDNPLMSARLTHTMDRFERDVAQGMDANQAEEMAIEEVRKLGQTMLRQWAKKTKQTVLDQARDSDPTLRKNGKKNSSGIPPSEPSQ